MFCQPAELGRSSGRFGQLVLEDGQWWAVAPLPGGVNNGAFSASGAYGQYLLVNPAEQVVVVIQGAWRQAHDRDAAMETVALLRAAVRALRADPAA